MRSLESEANPLRSRRQFYRPHNQRKSQYTKRNIFQNNSNSLNKNPILLGIHPNAEQNQHNSVQNKKKNILIYAGELQKVQYLHRDFRHQDLYYPDPVKDRKKRPNMYSTSHSRKNSLSTLHPINNIFIKTIEQERESLHKTQKLKIQRKSEMNLSFYNTNQKTSIFMDKFKDDKYLEERSSPAFQNMLHRTVLSQKIIDEARRTNSRKFVKGY